MNTNPMKNADDLCPIDDEGYGILPRMDSWSLKFFNVNDKKLAPIEYTYIQYHADKHKRRLLIALVVCLLWLMLPQVNLVQICGRSCENVHIYLDSLVNIDGSVLVLLTISYLLPSHHSYIFQIIYLATCAITIKETFHYRSCLIYSFMNFYLFRLPFHSFKNITVILLIVSVVTNSISDTCIAILFILCILLLFMQRTYSYETCERMEYFIKTTINHHQRTTGIQLEHLPFLTESKFNNIEDSSLLTDIKFEPVFISGCHRSGTTLLYEQLCKILPIAYVTPYSILYYNHLVEAESTNKKSTYIHALNTYFQLLGIRNRFIDNVKVSALNPPEEYWFVLSQEQRKNLFSLPQLITRYSFHLNSKSYETMNNLCRKLIYTQRPQSNIVLMKNPWDYGNEDEILKLYSNAKFIHIVRNPLEVINSAYALAYHHISGIQFDPYIWTIAPSFLKSILCIIRFMYALIGIDRLKNQLLNSTVSSYIDAARTGLKSLQSLPSEKVHTITYSSLIENPIQQLSAACEFIGIKPNQEQLLEHNCLKRPFRPTSIVQENSESIIQKLIKNNLPINY